MNIISRDKKEYPPRILKHRKQIKFGGIFLQCFSFFYLLIALVIIPYHLFADDRNVNCLWVGVIHLVIGLILYLEYLLLFKPLIISKIQVYKDKIFMSRGKKEITIPFNEVRKIKSAVHVLGGWFTIILNNKKKYRFTISLERIDYILDALIQFNPGLMEKDRYEKLRKSLISFDHMGARFHEMFGKRYRLITFFHLLFLPLSFCILLFYKQSSEFIIHSPTLYFLKIGSWSVLVVYMLWVVFLFLADILINKHMVKKLEGKDSKKRDTSFEHKVYCKFFFAYICILLTMMFGVYKTNLSILGMTSLSKGADYLNIKPGKRLWYDSRYNCTSCNYPLNKGDIVIVRDDDDVIGKVIGLPNEIVAINKKNKKGRFIASTKEMIIPSGSIALKTSDGEFIKLVEDKKVKGKVFKNFPKLSRLK